MTTLLIFLACTILLFIWGKLPSDVFALLSMLSLFLSGILNAEAPSGSALTDQEIADFGASAYAGNALEPPLGSFPLRKQSHPEVLGSCIGRVPN